MKTQKSNLKKTLSYVFLVLSVIISSCSDNSITGPGNEMQPSLSSNGNGITIEPYWHNSFLIFRLRNNTRDTIVNDFHVQFDSTVRITGYSIMQGWQIDPQTTDMNKGKFGVKSPNGHNIPPNGGVGEPFGVQLMFTGVTKKNPRQWWDFNWQATRDGIVVKSDKGAFPPR
ncbi:MAG: hypothetical protein N2510_00475 [Ignavibacteria bacterium]|nr:hypothetical protein [Ignavibacteria bacterium]